MVSFWTNSPDRYDYGYMVELSRRTIMGEVWRLVTTTDEYRLTNYQIPRYRSGLYQTLTNVEMTELLGGNNGQ